MPLCKQKKKYCVRVVSFKNIQCKLHNFLFVYYMTNNKTINTLSMKKRMIINNQNNQN